MERLGIVDELRERREASVSRLSPAARHQAFPALYARPSPREATAEDGSSLWMREKIVELKAKLASEKKEVARLNRVIANMGKPVPEFSLPKAVMAKFCEAMSAAGMLVEDRPWDLRDLKCPTRSKQYAHPRHVCAWLVKRVCRTTSTTQLGHLFCRDHTSMMFALRRAPHILHENEALRAVAVAVLATFGVAMPEPGSDETGEAS